MNILQFIQRSSFFVGASLLGVVGSAFADPNIDISVSKTASSPQVSAGQSITYTLEIENTGSVAIADAVSTVQDFMSNQNIDISSFTLTGIDATDSCTITQSNDVLVAILQGQYIECTLGAFTPGEVRTITYTIDTLVNVPDGTDIINTVYVNTDEEEANQKSDNSDSVTVQVNNNTGNPIDVSISKTASQTTAQVGDTITYTLEYENLGTGTANNVVIKDIPDREDLDLSSLQFTGFPIGTVCTTTQDNDVLVAILEGQYIQCTLNTLTPGQTGQITYSIQVLQNAGIGNIITNTVNISAENETETQSNNTSTSSVEVIASNLQTDLALTKTVSPPQAQPGETVTYSLTYENLGTEDAHNVVVIDFSNKDELDLDSLEFNAPLPSGIQCEISQNPDPLVAVFQGNYIQCTLGTVNAGDSQTISYTLDVLETVSPGSTVLNIATIGSTTTDSNTTNNSPSASLSIVNAGQSDLSLTKTTPNTEVFPGSTVPYTVTITNTGDTTARSIILKDISAGEKFDLSTLNLSGIDQNNCEVKLDPDLLLAIFQGPHIECSVPDILPGEQVVIDYTITLNNSAIVGDTILNGAQVSSGNETGALNNNQGTASITVVQDPNSPIDGACGTANQAYSNGTTNFGTDTFCTSGTAPATDPSFPNAGQTVSWTCSALNGGTDASCSASQENDPNTPIDGACGTANQAYSNGTTNFGTDTFCTSGTAPATDPSFPNAGQTVSWTCSALNGGNDASCSASQRTNSSSGNSNPTVVSSSSKSSPTVATSSGSSGSGGGCHSFATIDLKLKAFVQNQSGEYIDANSAEGALILEKNTNQTVSYKVIILNSGSVSAYNSEIQIDFSSPSGLVQSSISNIQGAEYADGKFKSEAKIPANGSYAITFDAKIESPASGSAKTLFSLVDFAGDYQCPKIESSEGIGENDIVYLIAGDAPIESLPTPVVVVSASTAEAYRISKTADKTEVSPGDEIIFTLSLENTGTQDLKNVMLFDIFPNEYLEVVGSSTGNLIDPETLKFKQKFLPQEDTFTVQVKMKVKPHVLDGTTITNVLKAGSQTLEITESSEVNLVVKGNQTDFVPSSVSASVSTPFRLVQTGTHTPLVPMGIILIIFGTGIAFYSRRKKA